MAGKFRVWRLGPEGYLDSDFGTGGVVDTNFAGDGESIAAMVLDSAHGRLYVAGQSQGDFASAAYALDGGLDGKFGGGQVRTDFSGAAASITAMDLKDDRFVVVGQAISGADYRAAFARYRIYAGQEVEPCYPDGSCDGNKICVPISSEDENFGGFCHS